MGAEATALAELVIDLKSFVSIFHQNAAIRTERVTVLAEAASATSKTALGFLNGPFPGKPQVDLIK